MSNPKVNVCISTYNRLELLKIAIQSVFDQTYTNWELIICDDGSNDATLDYMTQLKNDKIHYIRHPNNIGKSNNMRSGFEAANGDFFVKLDDDDRFNPDFLAHTVEVLDNYPDVDFVGTDHWIIDINNNRDIAKSNLCSEQWGRLKLEEGRVNNLLKVVFVHGSFYIGSTLFRRKSLEDVGYMRPNIQNCEDSDLFVRLALAEKTGFYLQERLMEYRFHAGQQGINRAIPFLRDMIIYLESYHFKSKEIELVRQTRLSKNKLSLGILLTQTEKTGEGRKLILEGQNDSYFKALFGLFLTMFNLRWRQKIFIFLMSLKRWFLCYNKLKFIIAKKG
jgi:glycosyltransferase involved in cell wall biosynthesis